MNEEENVAADNSNQQEEADLYTANENESDDDSESVEEVKARLAKAEELANNYKIRAEKAEKLAKASKESPEVKKQASTAGAMTTQDLYALMENKVAHDDIQEVQEYAQLKGISIAEALKSTVVKTILSEKAEMRNIASASNVGSVKRGTSKLSDEALVQSVKKGNIPETDEEMMRYVQARQRK
jgi:hypothetical protein